MKIIFQLHYNTQWGENLFILGSIPKLGMNEEGKALPMTHMGDGFWNLIIDLPAQQESFTYEYLIKRDNVIIHKELKPKRIFIPDETSFSYFLSDNWTTPSLDTIFSTEAFVSAIFGREQGSDNNISHSDKLITLQIEAPLIKPDEEIAIVGDSEEFGCWNASLARPLSDKKFPLWQITFENKRSNSQLNYKFIIRKKSNQLLVDWEYGENRLLEITSDPMDHIVISGLRYRSMSSQWRGAGVAIPIFSLRTRQSFGVGEFLDLKKMVDWATVTGQRVIQILPINDTTMTRTWEDTYPYNANSIYALHPIYLNIEAITPFEDQKEQERYFKMKDELNELDDIDYEKIRHSKDRFIEILFKQDNGKTIASDDFNRFFDKNSFWLKPYAMFVYLRDLYGTPNMQLWGENALFDYQKTDTICDPQNKAYPKIALQYYTQYQLHKQLTDVHEYARKNRIILKGDIPIGISRHSVEAWVSPQLFNLNSQAGAPPDDFSADGQNWGFPTYNWEKMEMDGYSWWKARFSKMEEYFDAYRIDHILGFFRIWEIPIDAVQGLLGHFNPALPYTVSELNAFGFNFETFFHAEPYITIETLEAIFGNSVSDVIGRFVIPTDEHRYRLRPEYSTQRKIEAIFGHCDNENSLFVRNGLYRLVADVLFVEDPQEPGKYHPRIAGHNTFAYQRLSDQEKGSYDQLYIQFYYHRHNKYWKEEAMKKLPALINASNMLVCGEDLGMIPQSVPEVMDALEIISLEVQRMPKEANLEFGDTANYPYLSLCTTSTHDMSGIRGWWEEDYEKSKRYFRAVLHEYNEAPKVCEPWICERIIDMHLHSPSILAVFPWQDWMAISGTLRRENPFCERINIPAISRHYWRYRMHIYLEDLLLEDEFNRHIKEMLHQSGRIYSDL